MNKLSLQRLIMWTVILGTLIITLLPIIWALSTSLKELENIATYPPKWIPNPITLANYRAAAFETDIPRNFLNSAIITVATIILTLAIATPAGYAAARHEFAGKNFLLFLLLSTMMVPGAVIIVPLYVLAHKAGLLDTYTVLILVYSAWRVPMVLWIMKSFFEGVPKSLEESAMVDGCTRLQAFYKVTFPLSAPGLAAAAIIVFVYVWNEFIIALTLTSTIRVITVGLYNFISGYGIEWGELMSAAMYALIPVLAIFFFFQKKLIQGLTGGALKE